MLILVNAYEVVYFRSEMTHLHCSKSIIRIFVKCLLLERKGNYTSGLDDELTNVRYDKMISFKSSKEILERFLFVLTLFSDRRSHPSTNIPHSSPFLECMCMCVCARAFGEFYIRIINFSIKLLFILHELKSHRQPKSFNRNF